MNELTSEQLLKLLKELPEWKELQEKVKRLEKEIEKLKPKSDFRKSVGQYIP